MSGWYRWVGTKTFMAADASLHLLRVGLQRAAVQPLNQDSIATFGIGLGHSGRATAMLSLCGLIFNPIMAPQ